MRGRILVVDDADHIRELFREILTDEGFEVDTAASPFADPAEIIYCKPDVIVLDYLFGTQPHGLRMLQQLASCTATRGIPTILCTASIKAIEAQEHELRARGGRVLPKPFAIDDLLLMIQDVLSCEGPAPALRPASEVSFDQERALLQPSLVRTELRPLLAL